jgi:hypothetical protein
MRTALSLGLVAMLSSVAIAQPGASYPAPAPAPVMQVQLSLDEQFLMERGYIKPNEHIGGGLVAVLFGLGVGHAVQGRWSDTGWIFTLGEGVSAVAFTYGFINVLTCGDTPFAPPDGDGNTKPCRDRYGYALVGGLVAGLVFRVWEVADAFIGPTRHNAKLDSLRARLGLGLPVASVQPYLAPVRGADGLGGGVAGLSVRF